MQYLEVLCQPDEVLENGNLVYTLPTDSEISTVLHPAELLQGCFDIPPNQSLGKWCPILIHADYEIRYNLPFLMIVSVIDASDPPKTLARYHGNILIPNPPTPK
jgi:hypothetical protein